MTRLTRRMMEQLEIGGRVRVVREQVSRGIVGLVGMGVDVRVEMDTVRGVARENMMLREVKVVLVNGVGLGSRRGWWPRREQYTAKRRGRSSYQPRLDYVTVTYHSRC